MIFYFFFVATRKEGTPLLREGQVSQVTYHMLSDIYKKPTSNTISANSKGQSWSKTIPYGTRV